MQILYTLHKGDNKDTTTTNNNTATTTSPSTPPPPPTPPPPSPPPPTTTTTTNIIIIINYNSKTVDFNKPDIVLIDRETTTALVLDIAVPLTHYLHKLSTEKITKCDNLTV